MQGHTTTATRAAQRVQARGNAVIHGDRFGRARILDISATGVRVHLSGPYGPYRRGERLDLELRFDGARGGWWTLRGVVVSVDGGEIALALEAAPADFEDQIQTQLLANFEAADGADVLLVDSVPVRRAETADSFRASGRRVSAVATPLDAIDHLGESRHHPRLIAIADTVPSGIAEELRTYMRREYPSIGLMRMMAVSA
jgi:hypothetical protein